MIARTWHLLSNCFSPPSFLHSPPAYLAQIAHRRSPNYLPAWPNSSEHTWDIDSTVTECVSKTHFARPSSLISAYFSFRNISGPCYEVAAVKTVITRCLEMLILHESGMCPLLCTRFSVPQRQPVNVIGVLLRRHIHVFNLQKNFIDFLCACFISCASASNTQRAIWPRATKEPTQHRVVYK